MINIRSKRVEGFGKGKEINFPTINFFLEKLPEGISEGMWASKKEGYKSISLVSKYLNGFRVETNVLGFNLIVKVGDIVNILFLKKLREPKTRVKNITKLIEEDKKLVNTFFNDLKDGCFDCQLCYVQDHGYSNYTVESSVMGCYVEESGIDMKYVNTISEEESKYNAIDCPYFLEGEYWHLDVDGESDSPTDEWIKSTIRDVKLNILLD